jgi:FkbM family methyltransferase
MPVSNGELIKIDAHGKSYQIHDPGGLIGNSLRAGVPYEAKVLEHIQRQELPEGSVAVDVGASVGNHSLWLAAICELAVIAVEPLDYVRLSENVAVNAELDIEVWPFALGDRTYRGEVTGAPAHVIGDSFPTDGVSVQKLDDYGLEDVSLIKIDVEGMEPHVLRGAVETIRREQPLIFAEAIDSAARFRNSEVLTPLGYIHTRTFGATPLDEWRPL